MKKKKLLSHLVFGAITLTTGLCQAQSNQEGSEANVGNGCDVMTTETQMNTLLREGVPLADPPLYDFTGGEGAVADMYVQYRYPVLAGCYTKLRQYAGARYDGRPVGPTMLIGPGQTYQADITNRLEDDPGSTLDVRMLGSEEMHEVMGGHGGNSTVFGYVPPERSSVNHNGPGDFNVTNLHTHGWHVDPTGNADNIFAAIGPGDPPYRQRVDLPDNHVAGSFWYHAHLHGSTALQVASGMAGALIVRDTSKGLDAVPQIAAAEDKIFVFQQLAYGEDGLIENYDHLHQGSNSPALEGVGYSNINRPVFVNGQAYPVIEVRVNEVQRWRFVHAGITDGIHPMIVRNAANAIPALGMYEIALDGLPIDSLREIDKATLFPGYRVDVLARFNNVSVGDTLYLVDNGQPVTKNITLSNGTTVNDARNLRRVLAQIRVVAGTPAATDLPSTQQIAAAKGDYIYGTYNPDSNDPFQDMGPLNNIDDDQITGKKQVVHFMISSQYACPANGGSCTPCLDGNGELTDCNPSTRVYMTCDGKDSNNLWLCMNFNTSATYVRTLELDTANAWEVSADTGQRNHIFHIHVNPFQVQRKYVDDSTPENGGNDWVWKDTLRTPTASNNAPLPAPPATLKSRYTLYTGAFVQHCHVLHHEDSGMMQVVEIEPTAQDIIDMLRLTQADNVEQLMLQSLRNR